MMDPSFIGDPGFELLLNNPFLDLLEGVNPAAPEQQLGGPAQHVYQPGRFNFKLLEYWDHAPGMWFPRAEFRFKTAGILAERQQFAYAIDALGYESLKLVNDLLLQPPPERPYSVLKEILLLASQLTAVQMAEKVMKMPDLGDRRPSQLLVAMLEFCPPSQQASSFFRLTAAATRNSASLASRETRRLGNDGGRHASRQPGGLKLLKDDNTGDLFLVDTVAVYCAVPFQS